MNIVKSVTYQDRMGMLIKLGEQIKHPTVKGQEAGNKKDRGHRYCLGLEPYFTQTYIYV